MANIGMPNISIEFKSQAVSAIERGSKGYGVLIVKDDTDTQGVHVYRSIDEVTAEEQAKFTADNVKYIKDALEGKAKQVQVFRMKTDGQLSDVLAKVKETANRNSWICMADATAQETSDLVSFIKSSVENDNKRYKGIVYKNSADDMHLVNFTNEKVVFADSRKEQDGIKAVPFLMGFLAGLPMTMSSIAYPMNKFERVIEPADVEAAVNKGEFVMFNDEGTVKVARGVNSLQTVGNGAKDDMKLIQTVEIMDFIYADIYKTWNDSYKGKYPNIADNQALLFSAITAYFKGLESIHLLDPNFENKAQVDVEAQRLANAPLHGDEVYSWTDEEVKQATVGTSVYGVASNKIVNATEDFKFNIQL